MRKAIVATTIAGLMLISTTIYALAAQNAPKFKDFHVDVTDTRIRPPLKIEKYSFQEDQRKLIETSYRGPVNFAGHFIFVTLSASERCENGFVIDVESGNIFKLEVNTCDWRDVDKTPFYFRNDSRLLVVVGKIVDNGKNGAHYFVFDGKKIYPAHKKKSLISALFGDDEDTLQQEIGKQGVENLKNLGDTSAAKQYDPQVIGALSKAVMFAVHRPVFNANWKEDSKLFGYREADEVAKYLLDNSITKEFSDIYGRRILFYNSDSDLFGLIKKSPDGQMMAGFMPGRQISEEIYKVNEDKDFLKNWNSRAKIVKIFFDDFGRSSDISELFQSYQKIENRSVPVNLNLIGFLKLTEPDRECKRAIEQTLSQINLSFADGSASSSLGNLFLSNWLIVPTENGTLSGAVSFHDQPTNRYRGYIFYDRTCKVTGIVTNVVPPL